MTAEVRKFTGITSLDSTADSVLEPLLGKLSGCVVIGWDEAGDLQFASSYADGGTCLWLLEKAKKALLEIEVER